MSNLVTERICSACVDSMTSAQFLRLYAPVALPSNAPPAAFTSHDPFPPVREGTYR